MKTAPQPNLKGDAQREFEQAAGAAKMDPQDKWVGGYAEYEWDHLRRLLSTYDIDVNGKEMLELGCNVGGSSVVLANLGARVKAIDIDPGLVRIAKANLARHDIGPQATAMHVADSRSLPFADASFDHVIANSVLEYVHSSQLDALVAELYRVLKPGGSLFICGTASRIAPREIHSGRWFVNYLPQFVDRLTGMRFQRGLSPFLLRKVLDNRFENHSASAWVSARRAIHGKLSAPARLVQMLADFLCVSPGWLSPHIEMRLQKTD